MQTTCHRALDAQRCGPRFKIAPPVDITVVVATTNRAKLRDMRQFLAPLGFTVVGRALDLVEPQSLDQHEVVMAKARQAHRIVGSAVLVDDTALFFDRYPTFPGTQTKFVYQGLGLDGVLRLIDEGMRARFRTLLAYVMDGGEVICATGELKGRLTRRRARTVDPERPWSSLFIPDHHDRPLAELDGTVVHSHRVAALQCLVSHLLKEKE